MAMYEVAFAFQAEDEGELSVVVGETLRVAGDMPDNAPEGWIMVERVSHADKTGDMNTGFVPVDFLEAITGTAAAAGRATVPTPATSAVQPSPAASSAGAGTQDHQPSAASTPSQSSLASLNDPRIAHLLNRGPLSQPLSSNPTAPKAVTATPVRSAAPSNSPGTTTPARTPATSVVTAPAPAFSDDDTMLSADALLQRAGISAALAPAPAFSRVGRFGGQDPTLEALREAHGMSTALVVAPQGGDVSSKSVRAKFASQFHQHEEQFQQAAKDRTQTFQALQTAMAELMKTVTACETRNSDTVQGIGELDAIIEEEATKWKTRLAQERRLYEEEKQVCERGPEAQLQAAMAAYQSAQAAAVGSVP